jgi:site-specific DNA-methyltransferase (adenine-specific)
MKPSFEPVVVARKPLTGTVAANVQQWGTGALNIDAARIGTNGGTQGAGVGPQGDVYGDGLNGTFGTPVTGLGRWPSNVVLDETQAAALDQMSGERPGFATQNFHGGTAGKSEGWGNIGAIEGERREGFNDSGGASRFFYTAKADAAERPRIDGVSHPTVKPLSLMRWLLRLVTPPNGTVLDPFLGSGTTAEAALLEGFRCIGVEREADYLPLIEARLSRQRDPVRAIELAGDDPGLFAWLHDEGTTA